MRWGMQNERGGTNLVEADFADGDAGPGCCRESTFTIPLKKSAIGPTSADVVATQRLLKRYGT
jgi:hypothetical protein